MIKRILPLIWLTFVVTAFAIGWWISQPDSIGRSITAQALGNSAEKPLKVAVAANFSSTGVKLAEAFESRTGVPVAISTGSSGTLFAQIKNGAPFDVFLSADSLRPQKLHELGLTVRDKPVTYAIGQLVLWLPLADATLSGQQCLKLFKRGQFHRVVLANPSIAPYGKASAETIQHLGVDLPSQHRILAENISQAFRLLQAGHAEAGFIAAAQWKNASEQMTGCLVPVPAEWHSPLKQQGVVLADTNQRSAAERFLDFLQSQAGQKIIREAGYALE